MGRVKKRYCTVLKDVNIGVNDDSTYKKSYKKGDKMLVPVTLIDKYKTLNIIE